MILIRFGIVAWRFWVAATFVWSRNGHLDVLPNKSLKLIISDILRLKVTELVVFPFPQDDFSSEK